ncbi:hypothetical protein [Pelagicoccus sp. SDUM812003]|uniref:hypothetical protein n=1 Tax=Pelagicoccus sp. SDUM812003 TaxID=3041267 RepID=UPI00280C5C44|nr:hypothetical protein [Pelagicoccus sp. SDUM812003]MDQ8203784.1 hypothetical protein [Pelagicoccus sp. SDUM812003]
MKSTTKPFAVAAKFATMTSLCLAASSASADSISDILDGFKEGDKVSLNARARYEYTEAGASEINGYSIRTRLGYKTGTYNGITAMIELEDISFNNPDDRPGLDVPTTELNQAWIQFADTKLGRQIYTLDDHRFIGHVGWRQNIQTFDAVTYSSSVNEATTLNFAYLDAVHRVNATSQDLSGLIANGNYKFSEDFNLTGFVYLLDFDRPVLASSDTYGLRGVGKFDGGEIKYTYSFSFAKQMDNSGSMNDFDLTYYAGEFGANLGGFTLAAGIESLGGDGTTGFTTPLATVHKFNGFADLFAGPSLGLGGGLPEGLEDMYVSLGFKAGDVPIKLVYHEFATENISDYLGSEIDLVASYKLNEYMTFVTKFADYSSDGAENVGYGGADKQVFTFEVNLNY